MYTHNADKTQVHFPSVQTFGHWLAAGGYANVERQFDSWERPGSKWFDYEFPKEKAAECLTGTTKHLEEARAMLARFQRQIETPRRVFKAGVAGSFVCVPDAIVGVPTSMRRAVKVNSSCAPIKVYVSLFYSCGVSNANVRRRGIAALAFALWLHSQRPVDLRVLLDSNDDASRHTVLSIGVPLGNMSLSIATLALTSVAFTRALVFGAAVAEQGIPSGIPCPSLKGILATNEEAYGRKFKEVYGLAPDDVFIGPATNTSRVMTDPEGWLQAQIDMYLKGRH